MAKTKRKSQSSKKKAKRTKARTKAPARSAKRKTTKRTAKKAPTRSPAVRKGVITHTELASSDPRGTQRWCEEVLGWTFVDPVPTPTGPYHMWRFANGTGGGIRTNNPPEGPGSTPYCEVTDIRATFAKALAAGATEMVGPMALPSGMGWIAVVSAPGGIMIGFWAPK